MMKTITIRNESEADYKKVEEITRQAFWNLYVPGCHEHYLVHVMRQHEDFLSALDFVIEVDGELVGNIMYTKSRLVDESGAQKAILTFGPVCIAPSHQRMGLGTRLMNHSFAAAIKQGYEAIVIFGDPNNYVSRGFISCEKRNICLENGSFPAAMMVKELQRDVFDGRQWVYYDSPVMQIDEQQAKRFDERLPKMAKRWQPSQETFYILSRARLR